ncbi:S1C family serine protease [Thermanaerothrix sp.]|jgi:serine protease Do|uniref:S1C family serine protease n=1 Tax=Thermanaerothrix sp. TaxID=2972675 RepID=UPI002ADE0208|nr:trypsin-like peptidase domain-containing protein [Thermanaerothrix sp.]
MFLKRATILLIVALILAACSGSPPSSPTAAPTVPAPTLENTPTPQGPQPVSNIEDLKKATIQIEAQGTFVDPEVGLMLNVAGRGSGFIIDPSGIAVTNNHVVTGAALIKVWVGGETEARNARILGVSECWDLAVIDIEGDGFPYLALHEGEINPGLEVYAAGFPLGDPEYTLTKGIVSKAKADGKTSWASIPAVIEHDARIRGGNSGGPLVDNQARVVGINYAGNNVYDMNFAIRAQDAMKIIETLRKGQDFESIGVNGQAVMSEDGSLSGIWVASVKSGSPASKAGIQGGDIITRMEGLVLATDGTMGDYCDILRTRSADSSIAIEVLRFDTQEVLSGELNGRPLETKFSFAQELGGDTANESTANTDYILVQDDSGAIQVAIPSTWSEVDGSPWVLDNEVIGASITAAASLSNFASYWDEPGIFFAASDRVAQLAGYIQLLDAYRESYRNECKLQGRYDYEDSAFEGAYDYYINCNGAGNALIVLTARPKQNKTAFLVTFIFNAMSDSDWAALDQALNTFDVVGTLP